LSQPPPRGLASWDGHINGYGKVVRAYKSTYKRHGTLNLFAALEVSTGKIAGKVTETKKGKVFYTFWVKLFARGFCPIRRVHGMLGKFWGPRRLIKVNV